MNTLTMTAREAAGRAIRGSMAEQRVTQTQLAERTGISRSSLVKKLAGQISLTSDDLDLIADALGLTMTDIVAAAERIRAGAA